MLSIGEFSNICKVSTKTLRYYAEIGLILPDEINPENGYRYYSVEQLETYRKKQIVSTQWIMESTKEHRRWDKINMSHGYLWWVENGKGYSAMGDGGNVIYIDTKKKLIISIASLFVPKAKDKINL